MSRPNPLNFLLVCLTLLAVQQALCLLASWHLWPSAGRPLRALLAWALLVGVAHAVLLLLQMPYALRWRPRRSARPSVALLQERRRIARDLHDRVGSRLVGALALLDPEHADHRLPRAALEQALLQLRGVVDGMDSDGTSLAEALAQLRYRMQPAFAHQGIALDWDTAALDGPNATDAPRTAVLALVAQEALSNVLQHARCTWVRVRVTRRPQRPGWELVVEDDGCGMDAGGTSGARAGVGMKSMRERMRDAGGEIAWDTPERGGTRVRATVPR